MIERLQNMENALLHDTTRQIIYLALNLMEQLHSVRSSDKDELIELTETLIADASDLNDKILEEIEQ